VVTTEDGQVDADKPSTPKRAADAAAEGDGWTKTARKDDAGDVSDALREFLASRGFSNEQVLAAIGAQGPSSPDPLSLLKANLGNGSLLQPKSLT